MSASAVSEDVEDEVEFVSEGPLRPVLECIDLLSDGEDEGGMSAAHTIEEQVDQQRAHAMPTLDRLARQVAGEKLERLEKCKAFKEKIISQQAHGRHELSVSHSNSGSSNAKRCVDIWLKMPGLQPGTVSSARSLWRRRPAPAAAQCSPRTCPVINCGRVYDNVPLLEGHLKRFDHSPCDPTITLRGSPSAFCACVACGRCFHSRQAWKDHVESMVSFPDTDGHSRSQSYQLIVCFACPACYLLFNIKDECLEHMSAKHFTQSITLWEKKPSVPIPVPRYAKNRLITLCKDIAFTVKCTVCAKVLTSHMEARAHFNVHCNNGCAIVSADQSVADIMRSMAVMGHCSSCPKPFFSLSQMEEHKELLKHEVKRVLSMDRALLYYSNYCEIQLAQKATECGSNSDGPSAKRQRLASMDSQTEPRKWSQLAWFCECGLRFKEEDQARKHLQAANQIFHKCAVCGKIIGESSIARLHMSRFHGGAHLSNFLFHCRQCKVEMPRMEDIMGHVGVSHRGHSYYQEREDTADDCVSSSMSPKPSTSTQTKAVSSCIPPPKAESWLCRMCEDLFDSEVAVRKHCGDLSSHSFQRFACGHCPQKFFKDSTLRRHCATEHGGDIVLRYFCGLCDSMLYDTEEDFQEHYNSLHSQDYYCLEAAPNNSQASMENIVESPIASTSPGQLCRCMGSEKSKVERKPVFTKCMKQLATENKCSYCCRQCDKNMPTYAEMKTHILLTHKTQGNEKSFDVLCTVCSQSHKDIPSFHSHYHKHHCQSEPCASSRPSSTDKKPSASISIINAKEIFPQSNVAKFQDVKNAITSRILDVKKEVTISQDGDDKFDQDIKLALALSAEEARKSEELDFEFEEALKRSLQEF
ncbi:E3 SUMO-protein ligase ZNF451-like isoform X1 [Cyprinus carpio]|uniref:E3 SUMO-protein ligase ZNF451-like isoform X1 n=3 Tax=Cyprinus carpio TaxID=7962 RepID=A0A9Q9WYN2_CYPCA|nr:E3 SUMO-protein ligase ZNF451-like isoform X1 [Cyprinus carpio]XP_042592022.1 E3 SUMO-protein ligase ZNF451-like isoform X1 [Cyprinus carpio]XP_042592023.1 E3 SUMO-protein ligase ZNF451-like isoform X1 [Cyprinus carpio]XP_042592024.1 E3 SUMO-protein ligase ZNF451-like isoform X1 [Cyprinus carpio]XP_042592025.1 E3 SUMO-protein ligase ZNF451-like isoform X1 [Cyprinus carpio]XP_042592026.1 E3 SUMO-protein ligase ZNF451-like isoform X1 [Cyprinus carpio]